MMSNRTPAERAKRAADRFVAGIPHAIAMFAAQERKPSEEAIVKYGLGMMRYGRWLHREASALAKSERKQRVTTPVHLV